MTRRSGCLLLLVLATFAIQSQGQPTVGISPDLVFHFTCKDVAADSLAGDLGRFLRRSGFRSLDLAKIQAAHGLGIVHFHMEALDSVNHWVMISSSPRHPEAYVFTLFSTPPTHHAPALEQSFIDFISVSMHCDVKNVDRHENGVEALDIFQLQVSRVEGLFQEAHEMAGKERH